MQKNQSLIKKLNTSEEKDLSLLSKIKNLALSLRKVPSLIKNAIVNNAQKMVDAIKSPKIKKQALALLASAVMITSAGCGEITPETQETNQIIHENTESEYAETSVLEKYEDVDGYVSDLANEILNDPKYPEYKATYNEEKQNFFDCYQTSLNPTCYDYYHKLYPNATDEEICKLTRVFYEFYGTVDNSLYVIMISSPKLSDNIEVGTEQRHFSIENAKLYSLLHFPNLTKEEQRDLILSNQNGDALNHALLLSNIFQSKKYDILAENLNNKNDMINKQFVKEGTGSAHYSISTYDNERKYNYTFVDSENGGLTLYYSEAELTDFDKESLEVSPKLEGIPHVRVFFDERLLNIIECDVILYSRRIKEVIIDEQKAEIAP